MIVGVGIDIVDIDRMRVALERTPAIVNKVLTHQEISELVLHHGSDRVDEKFVASVAARFAAKEATVKSLGLSLFEVGLHSIEIEKNESGVPTIIFPTVLSFYKSEDRDISFHCSLTHSTLSAAAVVIAQYVS